MNSRPSGAAAHVVVVGAGVTGLLTAVACARAGHRVTVLERGPVPNPDATSHDQHRAIRTLLPGDPDGTARRLVAHRHWEDLERLFGAELYRRVGVLTAWPEHRLGELLTEADKAGIPVDLPPDDRLPLLGRPSGTVAVRERTGGVLLADRVLRAAARWLAAQPGVDLRPHRTVRTVFAGSGRIVLADGEVVRGDLTLLAGGPWTRKLTDGQVTLYRQTMVYLGRPAGGDRWDEAPTAGGLGREGRGWVLPPGAGTLLKLSSDTVCRAVTDTDSSAEDQQPYLDRLAAEGILPDLDRYPLAGVRVCHYTADAATGGPLLARVSPGLWARAACGGSGFSTAPLVAERITAALQEAA
ncbi:FAD-binding oxidoreductase [Streptomyces sp. TLI_171]|uniref:NAD(P)/FAD-dependent oxidoreductase n=1 Tax=Streptomyces sp. TLI_171 TaxID=1938859 RepID=UPI000C3AC0A1|nr:FAD-binding oxidoreductase [Streptomyces sp. TLI_171]RKE18369.1 glycine/D-amino acid oxidase-like deaminating enzyme [Streptomyces sp. TLI_171]